jgi:phosphoglycerol transferase
MSIVLTLFTLAITGLALGTLASRLRGRSWLTPAAVWVSAGLVLVVGYWDQTSPKWVPDYEAISAEFAADANLVQAIGKTAGPEASILQMPYFRYPENSSINGVPDTDQLKPFLHSDTLHWSGGAIKGRATTEWQQALEQLPADRIPYAIAAAPFDGVLLDVKALTDPALRPALAQAFGPPVHTSHEGRFEYYDTRAVRNAMIALTSEAEVDELGSLVTHAVYARFTPTDLDGWTLPETMQPYRPAVVLDNPRPTPAHIVVSFDLTDRGDPAVVRLTAPDGSQDVLRLGAGARHVELELVVPPGSSAITITSAAGAALDRDFGSQGPLLVGNLEVRDPELRTMLAQYGR